MQVQAVDFSGKEPHYYYQAEDIVKTKNMVNIVALTTVSLVAIRVLFGRGLIGLPETVICGLVLGAALSILDATITGVAFRRKHRFRYEDAVTDKTVVKVFDQQLFSYPTVDPMMMSREFADKYLRKRNLLLD